MTLKEHKQIGNILNAFLDSTMEQANHFADVANHFDHIDGDWSYTMRLWNQAYEFIVGAMVSHMRVYDFDLTVEVDSDYE